MDKLCRQLNNGLTILDENELSDKETTVITVGN